MTSISRPRRTATCTWPRRRSWSSPTARSVTDNARSRRTGWARSRTSRCASWTARCIEYAETDAPYTYRVFQEGGETKIRYNFPPTSDSRRTIVIDYDVTDALRYYPENGVDQLYWKAVPAGNPFPTQSSTITLHAPEPATFTNYGIYGAKAEADFQPGQRDATIKVRGPINPGTEVEVVAEWQHGVVAGQPAAWQRELDQQAAAQQTQDEFKQRWGPVFDLGFLALAGLLIIGGPVLLYLWWYRKGRDHPVGLIADYLPEPPSDLPAGMVGTLIDERADMQDILATVLDLARRGALTIKETQEPGFLGIGTNSDFVYRRKSGFSETLRPYEDTLLDNMFKGGKEVELSSLKNKFYTAVPTIRKQLYQAVVTRVTSPATPKRFVRPMVAWARPRWLQRSSAGSSSRACLRSFQGSRCVCR